MKKYSFRQCTLSRMDEILGLRKSFHSRALDAWLAMDVPLSEQEKGMLKRFQELLILNSDVWNEQELSLHFIGPILAVARYRTLPFQVVCRTQNRCDCRRR